MIRFCQLWIVILGLSISIAKADTSAFAPGFTESVMPDSESGVPIQVIKGGKAGAPWVVLIHGLGQEASKDWLPILPVLAKNYRVLMFDLPGFGRSGRPDAALTPERYADLVHRVISHTSSEPVFVVGHSLGGAIALRHAYSYPEQVKRLLLIDAAGLLEVNVFTRHLIKVPDRVAAAPLLNLVVGPASRLVNRVSGRIQDSMAGKASAVSTLAGSDIARGLLYKDSSNINAALGLMNEDFSSMIPAIRPPVWILWGEKDPVAPLRTGSALRWLLPQAQLDILPKVGHVPMSEATNQTAAWLTKSLQGPLPLPRENDKNEASASQEDAVCQDDSNRIYRGHWRSIRLENCTDIKIENATLEQLVAINSTVTIENTNIASQGTALEAKQANITATGLRIVAPRAWNLEYSRLDLAATQVTAPQLGNVKDYALLLLSLSHWCDGTNEWGLHGVWKPQDGQMDQQVRNVRRNRCALAASADQR